MIVNIKDYANEMRSVPIDKNEVTRYCSGKTDREFLRILDSCISEAEPVIGFKVCYTELPITVTDNLVAFPFFTAYSTNLATNLYGCEKAVVFCATTGIGIDRLIKKYSDISPVKALVFQAIGTERIEALCDVFCEDIKKTFKNIKPRFSPGYGDFDLKYQSDIFSVLQCGKKIGVTLNNSLLMSPTKSVSAVVGIKE